MLSQPGRTGREISASLGLDKSRVNSFLYGEGRRDYNLVSSNWKWYPGTKTRVDFEASSSEQLNEPRLTQSLCAILSRLSVTDATLKIRSMPLVSVELAFAEDEYPDLDERLKVELVMRKKSLEAEASEKVEVTKKPSSRLGWLVFFVLGALATLLFVNQKPAQHDNQPQQGAREERILPER